MGKEKRKRVHSGKKHNMEEFYRKLDVKNKLKYAFGTVIVTFMIAIAVAFVSIIIMNVNTKQFYAQAYTNSVRQMEIRKDVQMTGKNILRAAITANMLKPIKEIQKASADLKADKLNEKRTDSYIFDVGRFSFFLQNSANVHSIVYKLRTSKLI